MKYRHLGKAGLKVSELSLGAWVTYGNQVGVREAKEIMKAAYDAGVNFFDNAEAYAHGEAEVIMGKALKDLDWPREQYLVSTKIFWGGKGPNDVGLNYKHVIEGVNNALKRFDLDYVDLVFAHRPDPETPIEETVWAFNQVIQQGKAFYWGTSMWSAAEIMHAVDFAHRNHLRPPSMEQPEYNMFARKRMEKEYAILFKELGYGTTTWSPLASGVLTGKYNEGVAPDGTRSKLENYKWLQERTLDPNKLEVANSSHCSRPGRKHGAAFIGLAVEKPQRQHGYHRCQQGRASRREHESGGCGRPIRRQCYGTHRGSSKRLQRRLNFKINNKQAQCQIIGPVLFKSNPKSFLFGGLLFP